MIFTSSGPDFFFVAAAAGLAAAGLEAFLALGLGLSLLAAAAAVAAESALDVFCFFEAAGFLAAADCYGWEGGSIEWCVRGPELLSTHLKFAVLGGLRQKRRCVCAHENTRRDDASPRTTS